MDNILEKNLSIPISEIHVYKIRLLSKRPVNPVAKKIAKRNLTLFFTLKLKFLLSEKLVEMPTNTLIQFAKIYWKPSIQTRNE